MMASPTQIMGLIDLCTPKKKNAKIPAIMTVTARRVYPMAAPARSGPSPSFWRRVAKYTAKTSASQEMPIRAPPPPAARLNSEGFQWFSSPTSRSTVTASVISAGISTSFDTFRFSSAMVALLGSSDVDERPHSNTVDVRPEVTDEVRWLERDHSRLPTSGRRRSAARRSFVRSSSAYIRRPHQATKGSYLRQVHF